MSLCDTCKHDCKVYPGNIQTCTKYASQPDEPPKPDTPTKAQDIAEKKLQKLVEDELHRMGYYRRNKADIMCVHKAPKGWQYHLRKPRGNEYLLDFLVWTHAGHMTEFELKIMPIRWAGPEQKALVQSYGLPVFITFDGAIEHVKKWEMR